MTREVTRRTVLRGVAGGAGALAVGAAPAAAQDAPDPDYDGWFDGVSNYDGTVDRTREETVRVTVGAEGNDGHFAFDPPAVRVDPGTTVVWEWTGEGGTHDVAAADGSFGSDLTDEAGHTFERTFEEAGVVRYACTPHETVGMKGAVVVGDPDAGGQSMALGDAAALGGGLGLVGVLLGAFALGVRDADERP